MKGPYLHSPQISILPSSFRRTSLPFHRGGPLCPCQSMKNSHITASSSPSVESTAKPHISPSPSYRPMSMLNVPISVLTDSYKATHYLQYPGAAKMVAVRNGLGYTFRSYRSFVHWYFWFSFSMASSELVSKKIKRTPESSRMESAT